MNDNINKVIEIAKSYKGTKEGKNNLNIFGEFFDKECSDFFNGPKKNAPYCMIYVLFCFVKAFGAEKTLKMFNLPKKSAAASCNYVYDRSKKIIEKPVPGAVIFFKGKDGKINHTGLITDVNKTHIFTMEGNKSDGLTKDCKYPLTSKKIYGYIMPDYSILETTEKPVTTPEPSPVPAPAPVNYKTYRIIAPSGLNIRKEPNTISKVLRVIPLGGRVHGIPYSDKWLKITEYTTDKDNPYIKKSGYIYRKWIREI